MIKLTLMTTGWCTVNERMMLPDQKRREVTIPALIALLEHPRLGPILFDTGYSPRYQTEIQQFPYSIAAKLLPVEATEAESAVAQLAGRGIRPEDIRYLIISHFHADHLGGLIDFPQAQYIYFDSAYQAVRGQRGWSALRRAYLPGLIPADFEQRSHPVELTTLSALPAAYAPFEQGVDLFNDGSLLAVPLPGHAVGQMGLFFTTDQEEIVLLAADACWHSRAYRELLWPHRLTNLIQADIRAYRESLTKLHHLHQNNPQVRIIPSHCREVYERQVASGR